MNLKNRRDKSSSNRSAKAIDAVPISGIVVAAVLVLSGLSTIGSSNSVFAQQNMTQGGGNATGGATGGNQAEVMMHLEEVRTALQNNDVQSAMMHLDLAMNLLGGGGTQGNMTSTAGSTNSTA
jgi:hypothetical protein